TLEGLGLLGREQARVAQPQDVRDRDPDVLRREPDVEVQASTERGGLASGGLGEPARPERPARLAHARPPAGPGPPAPAPWTSDHTRSGIPHSRTKPAARRWSNASAAPYVASPSS